MVSIDLENKADVYLHYRFYIDYHVVAMQKEIHTKEISHFSLKGISLFKWTCSKLQGTVEIKTYVSDVLFRASRKIPQNLKTMNSKV